MKRLEIVEPARQEATIWEGPTSSESIPKERSRLVHLYETPTQESSNESRDTRANISLLRSS